MAGYKILLVEDHQVWVDILERRIYVALQNLSHSGDLVKVVNQFEEAYKILKEECWHLLITDIGLGDPSESLKKNGKHLLRLAREQQVPAIAVSGTSAVTKRDVKDLYEKYRVSSFFDKIDFDEEQFITKVQELLQKPSLNPIQYQYPFKNQFFSKEPSLYQMQNAYALLIGIADYYNICPLSKTTNDAKDLSDTLVNNGYPQQNLTLLLDQNATKANMSKELNSLARYAQPDDTVIIFFSGHGVQMVGGFSPGEYLCPVEAELDRVKDTCISNAEFTDALRSIRADRLVVFIDACHSGGVGQPKTSDAVVKAGLSEEAYSRLATSGSGRVIIASCKPDEVSWELPGMRNGLFTHYLLEGMQGGAARPDGTVWISQLFSYVSEYVPQHKPQHPFQKSATEDFILTRSQPPHSTSQSPSTPSAPMRSRNQFDLGSVDSAKLREAIRSAYNLPRFRLLCQDLKFNYEDLQGETLMEKVAFLVEECKRFRRYEELAQKVLNDHPYLIDDLH